MGEMDPFLSRLERPASARWKTTRFVVHTGDMFAGAKPNGEKLKTFQRSGSDPVRSVEDGLPVEQFPPASRPRTTSSSRKSRCGF